MNVVGQVGQLQIYKNPYKTRKLVNRGEVSQLFEISGEISNCRYATLNEPVVRRVQTGCAGRRLEASATGEQLLTCCGDFKR